MVNGFILLFLSFLFGDWVAAQEHSMRGIMASVLPVIDGESIAILGLPVILCVLHCGGEIFHFHPLFPQAGAGHSHLCRVKDLEFHFFYSFVVCWFPGEPASFELLGHHQVALEPGCHGIAVFVFVIDPEGVADSVEVAFAVIGAIDERLRGLRVKHGRAGGLEVFHIFGRLVFGLAVSPAGITIPQVKLNATKKCNYFQFFYSPSNFPRKSPKKTGEKESQLVQKPAWPDVFTAMETGRLFDPKTEALSASTAFWCSASGRVGGITDSKKRKS